MTLQVINNIFFSFLSSQNVSELQMCQDANATLMQSQIV